MSDTYGPHAALWERWHEDHDRRAQANLVAAYQPLVRQVAEGLRRTIRSLNVDELMSHGQFGLLDALERFDPAMGVKFDAWAQQRIRGAIYDGIRRFDPGSRDLRARVKEVRRATEVLEQRLHRLPTDVELAGYLEVSEDQLHRLRTQELAMESMTASSPEDFDRVTDLAVAHGHTPGDAADVAELRDTIALAFARIEGPERIVLGLYYLQGMRMADIGRILGVGATTVSKIHARAISMVREQVEDIGSAWAP